MRADAPGQDAMLATEHKLTALRDKPSLIFCASITLAHVLVIAKWNTTESARRHVADP